MNPKPQRYNLQRRRSQRGVTMVSVMLLTVSLLTVGLLAVRSSAREVTEAGQLVARERALMVAQAAVDLASAQYLRMERADLNNHLAGFNPGGTTCTNACQDCIPDVTGVVTGQRNDLLAGSSYVDCGGRPCMRQGAVSFLPDGGNVQTNWCDVPFRDLVANGDPEANVSVWVRNNTADVLGVNNSGDWLVDSDGRVVVTAMAEVRGTVVTIEQELYIGFGVTVQTWQRQTADEGYGGGHNNDNSAVSVCTDDFTDASAAPSTP